MWSIRETRTGITSVKYLGLFARINTMLIHRRIQQNSAYAKQPKGKQFVELEFSCNEESTIFTITRVQVFVNPIGKSTVNWALAKISFR